MGGSGGRGWMTGSGTSGLNNDECGSDGSGESTASGLSWWVNSEGSSDGHVLVPD